MKHRMLRLLILLFLTVATLMGLMRPIDVAADSQSNFIQNMSPTVVKVAKQYNLYASLMLAQAALESGFGQSQLSLKANNYFGIKGSYNGQSVTMPTTEYNSKGRQYTVNAQFKKYPNVQSSLNDYAQLLRHGLIGNASFYSGSWKENAQSVDDAANSLVGKYATAPSYANNLLNVINSYNLTSLDKGITVESNQVADNDASQTSTAYQSSLMNQNNNSTSSSSSDTNSSSGQSDSQNINNLRVNVQYTRGAKNQVVNLANNHQTNRLYTVIPGTTNQVEQIKNWDNEMIATRQVVVDMMGKDITNNQIWYRIRSKGSNNAPRYWVQASALSFPTFDYKRFSGQIKVNQLKNSTAYNHILSTPQIAVKLKNAQPMQSGTYNINMIATDRQDLTNNWVRYKTNDNKQAWVKLNGNQSMPIFKTNVIKSLRADYGKYKLYTNLPVGTRVSIVPWSVLKLATIDQVTIKALALRFSDRTLWYQVNLADHKYWLSAKALN